MTTGTHTRTPGQADSGDSAKNLLLWLGVIALVYLLITAVGTISSGFKTATGGQAKELFAFATNPILGLLIGTMATALIQSSSTVTSIIVALVAGGLPITIAVPMVMGANIGTTITNTIVSLGHVRDKEEFQRAFAAATVHDFFNLLSVLIFLPLEIMFGFLEKLGLYMASFLVGGESMSLKGFNFIKAAYKPVVNVFKDAAHILPHPFDGIFMIVLGIVLIFIAILYMGRILKKLMVGKAKEFLHAAIGRGPVTGILSGTGVTVLVQSSSTTTSLMVPLAGSGVLSLRQIYPFTLGANIGTTVTALLAATAIAGDKALFALAIALIHFAYNIVGCILIYGLPPLRVLPIYGAEWLAGMATKNKLYALAYVLGVFFIIPGVIVGISNL